MLGHEQLATLSYSLYDLKVVTTIVRSVTTKYKVLGFRHGRTLRPFKTSFCP